MSTTHYVRSRVLLEDSLAADYTQADTHSNSDATTPTKVVTSKGDAAVAGTTIELGNFTTVERCILYNLEATNAIRFQARCILTAAKAYADIAFDGTAHTIVDGAAAGTFITDGSLVNGFVRIASAADSEHNDARSIITVTDADTLVLTDAGEVNGDTIQTNASDSVTIQFEGTIQGTIPAGAAAIINNLVPQKDLVLTAVTAVGSFEAVITGT